MHAFMSGLNLFLCDLLRPASGVRGDDRVYPARPSALYTPTGPLGRSVASVDLKQPSMHRRSLVGLSAPMCSLPSHEQFFLSRVRLLHAADVAGNRLSQNRAQTPPRERDRLGGVSARFAIMSSVETAATGFNDSAGRSIKEHCSTAPPSMNKKTRPEASTHTLNYELWMVTQDLQQKIMWQNSLDVQFSWSKPAQNPGSLKSEETRLENFRAGQLVALASLVLNAFTAGLALVGLYSSVPSLSVISELASVSRRDANWDVLQGTSTPVCQVSVLDYIRVGLRDTNWDMYSGVTF
ncbi:hypothetical protein THAOC_08253 [Thalassiosira oceanica]|uniref:Uncharacterized protein n=1 Tax=Thalassiosira oceanica TaxID=159749 RepID=K0SVF8_THAOC|nr:hypothetical protein THAOC_08253 [Thalassiosira oceanica]|eukprot:EJK70393.1 hypothetical protein THAOC_08253 [Thalassiosira oceanica]